MERNVPRDLWLYPDRGMKKWLGWILSDHSAFMEDQGEAMAVLKAKPQQSATAIDDLLLDAWQQSQAVAIQLYAQYNDSYLPDVTGAVVGFENGQLYLQRKTGSIQALAVEDIRNVQSLDAEAWWSA